MYRFRTDVVAKFKNEDTRKHMYVNTLKDCIYNKNDMKITMGILNHYRETFVDEILYQHHMEWRITEEGPVLYDNVYQQVRAWIHENDIYLLPPISSSSNSGKRRKVDEVKLKDLILDKANAFDFSGVQQLIEKYNEVQGE